MHIPSQRVRQEMISEAASIWYVPANDGAETAILIKAPTPSIKALVAGCSIKLTFGKSGNYLCTGAIIADVPDAPLVFSGIQRNLEEHLTLLRILQDRVSPIFLFNEMDVCVAWANATLPELEATKVFTFIGNVSELYIGPFTEETSHALDCFCFSFNQVASYPNASIIPTEELKLSVDSWNAITSYFYGENNFEPFGEFYLNPDTIYDGVSYSLEAKADSRFHFSVGSALKQIVDGLKTYNWPQQENAINKVSSIDYAKASINELFVLGRNIYQAACGSSFACQRFINNFGMTKSIPNQAKVHILNGMSYEIYFDSRNSFRKNYKSSYLSSIVSYLEQPEFYASREFIASHLCKVEDRPIYIPGQNELMYFSIRGCSVEAGFKISDMIYQGRSVLYDNSGQFPVDGSSLFIENRCFTFEQSVILKIAAPADCVRFQYDNAEINNESTVLVPFEGFSIRFSPDTQQQN